jgi:hypothetical protein
MVDRISSGILRRLVDQWDNMVAELQRLSPQAQVRPAESTTVFRPTEAGDDILRFEQRPVVFNVPERPLHRRADLFVALRGRIAFRRQPFVESGILETSDFGTEVGYFRRSQHTLTHVYGAHYDFARSELGHPVFHVQMKSYAGFSGFVREHYTVTQTDADSIEGVLRTVRLPSAQMDIFSLVLQISADHLLHAGSGSQEKAAFNALLRNSAFCKGVASSIPRLGSTEAASCYRARHWYPSLS